MLAARSGGSAGSRSRVHVCQRAARRREDECHEQLQVQVGYGTEIQDLRFESLASLACWHARPPSHQRCHKHILALGREAVQRCSEYSPRGLASLAWALATVMVRDQPLEVALTSALSSHASIFESRDLTTSAWAIARLSTFVSRPAHLAQQHPSTMDLGIESSAGPGSTAHGHNSAASFGSFWSIMASQALRQLGSFAPQDISTMAWALAKQSVSNRQLFTSFAHSFQSFHAQFSAQSVANIAWAFATASMQEQDFVTSLSADVLNRDLCVFSAQGISNIAWALAVIDRESCKSLGVQEQRLFAKLEGAIRTRAAEFSAQGLANIAWAFASSTAASTPLFDVIGAEVVHKHKSFLLQPLANICWAFAVVSASTPDAFRYLSARLEAILESLPGSPGRLPSQMPRHLAGICSEVIAAVWALRTAGHLSSGAALRVRRMLDRCARVLDFQPGFCAGLVYLERGTDSSHVFIPPRSFFARDQPSVALKLSDRLVVRKPPGWEVKRDPRDVCKHAEFTSQIRQLSLYIRSMFPASQNPIVSDILHNFGMIHRLDVPNSGLLLVAQTYQAYYDLALQLNSGSVQRDYVVLCHGWVASTRQEVLAPLHWQHGALALPTEVCMSRGKPARTKLKVLGHFTRKSTGEAFSLVCIRIETGRRHQIRCHLAHIGHPVTCDGKYSNQRTFSADELWCARNFLHRYQLSFSDCHLNKHRVSDQLPTDLQAALQKLSESGPLSRESFHSL